MPLQLHAISKRMEIVKLIKAEYGPSDLLYSVNPLKSVVRQPV